MLLVHKSFENSQVRGPQIVYTPECVNYQGITPRNITARRTWVKQKSKNSLKFQKRKSVSDVQESPISSHKFTSVGTPQSPNFTKISYEISRKSQVHDKCDLPTINVSGFQSEDSSAKSDCHESANREKRYIKITILRLNVFIWPWDFSTKSTAEWWIKCNSPFHRRLLHP